MYGCHNRKPFHPFYHAQDGYKQKKLMPGFVDSTRHDNVVQIPHVMTKDCQYTKTDLGKTDLKCEGCKHKEPV